MKAKGRSGTDLQESCGRCVQVQGAHLADGGQRGRCEVWIEVAPNMNYSNKL